MISTETELEALREAVARAAKRDDRPKRLLDAEGKAWLGLMAALLACIIISLTQMCKEAS